MKRGCLLIALLLATLSSGIAHTAEPPEAEPDADPAPGRPATTDPESPQDSPEIFVPTEEISEDFAVPFPVDI